MRFIVIVLILLIPIVLANPLQLALRHHRHHHPFAHPTEIGTDLPIAEAEEEGALATEVGTDASDHEGTGTEDSADAGEVTAEVTNDDTEDGTDEGTASPTEDGTQDVTEEVLGEEATPAEDTVDENAAAVSTSPWYSRILKIRKAFSSSSSLVEVLIEQPQVLM